MYLHTHDKFSKRGLVLPVLWLFLLSPIFLYPFWGNGRSLFDALYIFNLATSLLWFGTLHFSVRRPFLLHLLLAPFYVTTAVDLFLIGVFGTRLSSAYIYIALTDGAEAGEFFATYMRPLVICAIILACIYLPGLLLIRQLRLTRSPKISLLCGSLLAATYLLAIALAGYGGATLGDGWKDIQSHEFSAPFGSAFQVGLALEIADHSKQLQQGREEYSFNARSSRQNDGEIYVWIIGESSRPQNWSLFGYERDTTPRLRSATGIIALANVLTTAPHTAVAVPSMLSLRPITDWDSIVAERSIVSAFTEAGFVTHWLSCQEADSWAGLVPVLAGEANYRRYFQNGYDGQLLEEFRARVNAAAPGQKLFFVLHSKGSHFEYSRRYPAEFDRFNTLGGDRRVRLIDSYDNSVLYTDWFISEVIATLAKQDRPSAVLYASDHGENLLDDQEQLLGHAFGNQYDLSTVGLIWLSKSLRKKLPAMTQNAVAHAHASLSLSNISHSVLDLAGVEATGLDRRLSIFSSDFTTSQRSYIVRGTLRSENSWAKFSNSPTVVRASQVFAPLDQKLGW